MGTPPRGLLWQLGSRIATRWKNTAGSWKAFAVTAIVFPIAWNYNERQKAIQKKKLYSTSITDHVYFDVAINNHYVGRILIGLYGNHVPMSVENFVQLCQGYKVEDKVLGYRNTIFHRVYPGVGLLGGDVLYGEGRGQLSIYGTKFPDENFDMEFVQDGDVALVNSGPHSNSSQFMITFAPLPIFHRHNVVIGTVIKGMRIIRMIEQEGTRSGVPRKSVRIVNCGLYNGPEDGPPFFAAPELLERLETKPMTEEDFLKLPPATQRDMSKSMQTSTSNETVDTKNTEGSNKTLAPS